jgi:hypothetical protein
MPPYSIDRQVAEAPRATVLSVWVFAFVPSIRIRTFECHSPHCGFVFSGSFGGRFSCGRPVKKQILLTVPFVRPSDARATVMRNPLCQYELDIHLTGN